jgi:hypothetical protein
MRPGPERARLDARESLFLIDGPCAGTSLFLRRLGPTTSAARRAVLYLHGATFPSALSIAHRFDGESWRDALCAAQLSVWGLDLVALGTPEELTARLGLAAKGSDVLVDYDVFESITNAGKMLLLTSWRSADDAGRWTPKTFADVAELRHRRVRNVREYGMFERREAAQYFPDAKR